MAVQLSLVPPLHAFEFKSRNEALTEAFPAASFERKTVFLTPAQVERAEELAGFNIKQELLYVYEARAAGVLKGTVYFDAHRVRTLPETLMVVVTPEATIKAIHVLAFREPAEYLAPATWYEQFPGRTLDRELEVRRGIQGISGATLTARATLNAARRVLAIHQALKEMPP